MMRPEQQHVVDMFFHKEFCLFMPYLLAASPLWAEESVFSKAKRCQQKGGVWIENHCAIEIDGETEVLPLNSPVPAGTNESTPLTGPSPEIQKSGEMVSPAETPRKQMMYIGLGHPLQATKGRTKAKVYGAPDPYYTWDDNGYYGPNAFGTQHLSLDSEYSSETEFTLGWATMRKNDVGFSLSLTYSPESEIEREGEAPSDPHDKFSRLSIGGRIFYSFGANDAAALVFSPFMGAHHALNGQFESASPDVNVEAFDINLGFEYGFKLTVNRHFEIDLVHRETPWTTRLSSGLQGQFARRNSDGSYTRVPEITAYIQIKETMKEQMLQFVFIL
jgi:hypothetical protein